LRKVKVDAATIASVMRDADWTSRRDAGVHEDRLGCPAVMPTAHLVLMDVTLTRQE
jgi:hypothetical protein